MLEGSGGVKSHGLLYKLLSQQPEREAHICGVSPGWDQLDGRCN